jgi:hypothetical protein
MKAIDFYYSPTDEDLRAYAELTPLERLQRLDNLRRFTLMVREARTVFPTAAEPSPAEPYPGKPAD